MRAICVIAALLLLSCQKRLPEVANPEAEVKVYVAPVIRTNDPSRPIVQAMAVKDGDVVAIGTEAEVMDSESVRLGTFDVVRVHGIIVPGLVDSHAHLASLGRALVIQSLRGTTSAAAVVAKMKSASKDSYQGDWLVGRGWDQNDWAVKEFPARKLLDDAFPDTPVYLTRIDGHAAWVNKAALDKAGVTKATPDPKGGRFLRDAAGEPTGVLVDNAMDVVLEKIPPPTPEQHQKRLRAAMDRVVSVGLTGIHDAGMDMETFRILQAWDALNLLPIRIYSMAEGQGKDAEAYLGLGPFQGMKLQLRAVKLLADGALGSRGAALHAPYSDEPSQSGLLLLTPEELDAKVTAFMERGFQVAVHAIGDRANTLVLDSFEKAIKATGGGPGRHRLEHAQVMRMEDIKRLASLGVIASMQPTHATSDMPWAEARVGPQRIQGAYAWKTVLNSGAALAFGSDFPVEDPEPLAGFYSARTRRDPNGKPEGGWMPHERLTGEETLAAFTTGAAYASFLEDKRGQLTVGMDADFVVLDQDPVTVDPKLLLGAKVMMTVVAGVPVYEERHEMPSR